MKVKKVETLTTIHRYKLCFSKIWVVGFVKSVDLILLVVTLFGFWFDIKFYIESPLLLCQSSRLFHYLSSNIKIR